jgi:N-acetylglucosamine kinase-like BadF-type ATPase
MNYLLAVDGGGTKTKVLCADESGVVVGEGLSGPTNLTATTVGAASFNLREGIRQATENLPEGWNISRMVIGLAGMDTSSEHNKAHHIFEQVLTHFRIGEVKLVNDIEIALESGTDKSDAVALISGTGSNCFARSAEGKHTQVGGMDFLLTDQGSGYAIGRAVLRRAVSSYDGRIERTMLEDLVCQHFKLPSIGELKDSVYHPLLSKPEIAGLSKVCSVAFEKNDSVARIILEDAVNELYLMVSTAMTKLGITDRQVDMVMVGGVTTIPFIQERLTEKLTTLCPKISIIRPDAQPVTGALKMALRNY